MKTKTKEPSAIAEKCTGEIVEYVFNGRTHCEMENRVIRKIALKVQSAIDEALAAEERDLTQFENDIKKLIKEHPLVCPHCGKGTLTPEPEGGR